MNALSAQFSDSSLKDSKLRFFAYLASWCDKMHVTKGKISKKNINEKNNFFYQFSEILFQRKS